MFQKIQSILLCFVVLFLCNTIQSQPKRSYSIAEIDHLLGKLNNTATVLYIAAHPDDENTRLLAYLAGELKVRTAYVSLTRGDGGQNLLGTEVGPELGLIRSYELMAARHIDRADQFFTRAYDFGYSKNGEETLTLWDRKAVLEDLVFIIRYYRPDILITRFATDGSGGHGHHTASAILAEEAFIAAGDPTQFPEQLSYVTVWQPKRLLYNNAAWFRDPNADMSGNIPLDVGKYNQIFGLSYGEISGLSRSMHKSQGFGSYQQKGEFIEYFLPILGDHPTKDIFDHIPMGLSRIEGSETLTKEIQIIQSKFDYKNPSHILPQLAKAYAAAELLQDTFWRSIKKEEIAELMRACSGLWIELTASNPTAVAGENITFTLSSINRSNYPVTLQHMAILSNEFELDLKLSFNQWIQKTLSYPIPKDISFTGPYWLRKEVKDNMFQLDDIFVQAKPVDLGHLTAEVIIDFNGLEIPVVLPLMYKWLEPTQGEQFRLFEITPEVMVEFIDRIHVFTSREPKIVKVKIKAGANNCSGNLKLLLPEGFTSKPESIPFQIDLKDKEFIFEFTLTPPAWKMSKRFEIGAEVSTSQGNILNRSVREIKYDHIPAQIYFPIAKSVVVLLDLNTQPCKIAYIQGAGDEVAKGLKQMGYQVDEFAADDIGRIDLYQYPTVVLGVRAFNVSEKLVSLLPMLHQYVKEGGNLVVQYNTNSWAGPLRHEFAPFPMKIGRGRVTDESAFVSIDQNDPILHIPNKISDKDFEDWIQERGLYFASEWDEKFRTPLKMNDPGEKPQLGSLLISEYGKGRFIYTGLSFFRQIPHGVPGAFRLLSNLVEPLNKMP